jgi:hypothetical protein
MSDRARDRLLEWLAFGSLVAMAAFLLALPALPLQDYPNHQYLLKVARELAVGDGASPHFELKPTIIFGYSLYLWLTDLLSKLISVEQAFEWVNVGAAVCTPLAVGRLARVLGARRGLAILLSLPLAFSWAWKIGLISFAVAVPAALMTIAECVMCARDPRPRRYWYVSGWLLATWMAHPIAALATVPCLGLSWFFHVVPKHRQRLIFAGFPMVLAILWDTFHGAFSPLKKLSMGWNPDASVRFRPLSTALSQLVTRGFGITGQEMLLAFVPLLLLLAYGIGHWVSGEAAGERPRVRGFWMALLALLALAVLALPENVGAIFLIASRLAVLFTALAIAIAAAGLRRGWMQALAIGAALAATAASGDDLRTRAHEVAQMTEGAVHAPAGRHLTLRLSGKGRQASERYGDYDPVRHVWAYVATSDAVTPYAFAFSPYLPVLFRAQVFQAWRKVPHEWVLNVQRPFNSESMARTKNKERVLGTIRRPDVGSLLVYGSQPLVDALLVELERAEVGLRRLGPGFLMVTKKQSDSDAIRSAMAANE